MNRLHAVFVLLLLAFTSLAVPYATAADKEFDTAVKELREMWVASFNARVPARIGSLYTDDAVMIATNGMWHGRDEIVRELQKGIDRGDTALSVVATKDDRSGDMGYEAGTFTQTVGGGQQISGRYLITLKKVNGRWLIAAECAVPNQ